MTAPEKMIPAFFTVYIPELCSPRMQIPSAFTCYMKGKLTAIKAFLRNNGGSVWPVDVIREGRDLYFEKGWARFVEENNVEMGDSLFFQFSGDYFYDFKHFGRSCCEKETVGSFKFTVKPKELEVNIEENEEAKNRSNLWTGEEKDEYDDEMEEEEEEDYEEGIEFETFSSRMKKTGKNTNAGNKGKAAVEDEAGPKKNVNGKGVGDIFKSGVIKPPRNPYFVAPPSKRRELHIPRKVIKRHKLKIPDEIIITSKDGWEFVATIITRMDGRKVIVDGWRAFCARYQVEEEDRCLCEFFLPQTRKLLIRAFHFHQRKWNPRP